MRILRTSLLIAMIIMSISGSVSGAEVSIPLQMESLGTGTVSIPRRANRVPMATVRLTASCERDHAISEILLEHRGLGDVRDLSRLYLMSDGRRLSRALPFSTGRTDLTLPLLRGFTLKRCESKTFQVMADFSADAATGGEHQILVKEFGDAVMRSESSTSASNADTGTRRIAALEEGTLMIEFLPLQQTPLFGAQRVVARLRIIADADHAQEVHAITLTNRGSAGDVDLQKIRFLTRSGDVLSPMLEAMDGRTVHLTFDPPLFFDRHEERSINLVADIRASRRRTINFHLDELSDVDVRRVEGRRSN